MGVGDGEVAGTPDVELLDQQPKGATFK